MTEAQEQRFWEKVQKTDKCWYWTASVTTNGYGQFHIDRRAFRPHRLSYELLVAPIPEGLVLDHLCKNILCVNPQHLEPVTQSENMRRERKKKCIYGHTDYVWNGKRRHCRGCAREGRMRQHSKQFREHLKRIGFQKGVGYRPNKTAYSGL
jgi:hypothetical protein